MSAVWSEGAKTHFGFRYTEERRVRHDGGGERDLWVARDAVNQWLYFMRLIDALITAMRSFKTG